jgi:hypothetical protein
MLSSESEEPISYRADVTCLISADEQDGGADPIELAVPLEFDEPAGTATFQEVDFGSRAVVPPRSVLGTLRDLSVQATVWAAGLDLASDLRQRNVVAADSRLSLSSLV